MHIKLYEANKKKNEKKQSKKNKNKKTSKKNQTNQNIIQEYIAGCLDCHKKVQTNPYT
jgi:hypothetical protein